MSRSTIYLEPMGGLGNRMRAIDAAASLAGEIGHQLVVIWNSTRQLGATYLDLFEPIDGIQVVQGELVRAPEPIAFIPQERMTELTKAKFDFTSLRRYPTIMIRTWEHFYPSKNPLEMFVAAPPLRERIGQLTEGFDQTIGVHVRRTDNAQSIIRSPTAAFLQRMQKAIDTNEARTFFLATDDPAEEEVMRAEFGGRILTQEKRSLNRSDREAIEDAVVDLYALAATRRLFGSHWSSFSNAAALIGHIKVEWMGS